MLTALYSWHLHEFGTDTTGLPQRKLDRRHSSLRPDMSGKSSCARSLITFWREEQTLLTPTCHLSDIRSFMPKGLGDLQGLGSREPAEPRMELLKHVSEIRMFPQEGDSVNRITLLRGHGYYSHSSTTTFAVRPAQSPTQSPVP